MPITPLPPAPDPQSPGTFNTLAPPFVAALPTLVTEINAVAALMSDNAVVNANALAAIAIFNATPWVSGTTYTIGQTRYSLLNLLCYRRKTNGAGTTDPRDDNTNWMLANIDANVYDPRTANAALNLSDWGKWIDITANTFSQTFDAAAALGSGWWCYLQNSGTGIITLDPNASELVDGLATTRMYPGEIRIIRCTGAAFISRVLRGFTTTFTTTGDFVMPSGYNSIQLDAVGGGGGGSHGSTSYLGAGGGGGGRGALIIGAPVAGSTTTVTIGAGGAGGDTAAEAGAAGGDTTFGALSLASGGGGGGSSASAAALPGNGGSGLKQGVFTDNINAGGWYGARRTTATTGISAAWGGGSGAGGGLTSGGGSSLFGAAGGGGGSNPGSVGGCSGSYTAGGGSAEGVAGADETTGMLCGGGGGGTTVSGGNGGYPGGGGGGGAQGASGNGGNGGAGRMIIRGLI